MPKVLIPNTMKPNFCVSINGTKYSYPAGTEQDVPDEVAQIIENHVELYYPEPKAGGGGAAWDAVIAEIKNNVYYNPEYAWVHGSYEELRDKIMAGDLPRVLIQDNTFVTVGGVDRETMVLYTAARVEYTPYLKQVGIGFNTDDGMLFVSIKEDGRILPD